MEYDEKGVSYLVFVGFVVLFLLFLFLNPDTDNTSTAIIGSTTLGESPSIITLIVLFIVLIVVLAVVFVILKRLKKKKIRIESPKPVEHEEEEIFDKKESKSKLEEGDIEKLFSEEEPKEEKPEIKREEYVEELEQPQKKEVLINLQDLKNKIKGMLTQKLTKEQIIGSLKSQGVDINQINKAIEEVNIDNLRGYITQALKQGFTRDQIIRNLAAHGWKQEQINKVI